MENGKIYLNTYTSVQPAISLGTLYDILDELRDTLLGRTAEMLHTATVADCMRETLAKIDEMQSAIEDYKEDHEKGGV